jgi:RND family efflux transporter MFP subunit
MIALLGGVHPHESDQNHRHEGESVALTRFGQQTELYLELPPLVADTRSEFLVHLTRLSDYRPIDEGQVSITLTSPDGVSETFGASGASRPGLFRIHVTPRTPGARTIRIQIDGPGLREVHALGEQQVHPDLTSALAERAHATHAHDEGDVTLLKEQQWRSDFAPSIARMRRLMGSVPATGVLRPSADGEAHVTIPIDGHLRSAPRGFPYTGMHLEQGEVIAYLVPQLGGEADLAGLELAVTRAESVTDLARQERERLDALWKQRSVPYRQVLEARSAVHIAEAELEAARKRLAQVQRTTEGEAAGFPIRAPITGSVAHVYVAPGSFVEEGDRLFHIVDPERMWLEAKIAEADIGQIRQPRGAWFKVQGLASTFDVSIEQGARLVAFSAMVEPDSRTVPVVFEFASPDPRLRAGMFVTARVYTGEERRVLCVPVGAVINDAGADVVYVQKSGEHFERRVVRTGLRDGDFVAIEGGLAQGERVVSRGAYLVHLAAGAPADIGHGHAH